MNPISAIVKPAARGVLRATHWLAPGVTADIAVTIDNQVELVLPGRVMLDPTAACMLGLALQEASRIAGQRAAARKMRRTKLPTTKGH